MDEDEKCVENCAQEKDQEYSFEKILQVVGDNGRFQKRFSLWYNFIFCAIVSMPGINLIIAFAIPDHWCLVPGRELTNLSVAEWKDLTIPRQNNSLIHEKCKMYNVTIGSDFDYLYAISNHSTLLKQDCQYGWEYDRTWYGSTQPSAENWVCDKDDYVANILALGRVGEALGAFIFGQLSDSIGRRPTFYLNVILIVMGRIMHTFISSSFYLVLLTVFISSTSLNSTVMVPMVLAIEITGKKGRAQIALYQNVSWVVTVCFTPLIMWAVRDWIPFIWLSTLPSIAILFADRIFIESPRWLASKGKKKEALKVLEKIAKVNGTTIPEDAIIFLNQPEKIKEKSYGFLSLFSHWRVAKNTLLMITNWVIAVQILGTLILNVAYIGGNPYLIYFMQGIAELPSYYLGKYLCDTIGRKFTHIIGFLITIAASIPSIFTVSNPDYELATTLLSFLVKFGISFCIFSLNLQSMEIYPTCLRQTGNSLGFVLAHIFGILSPYIVYWGISGFPTIPYIIFTVLCIIAIICCVFLPETLNQELPETINDAKNFGANQEFFMFPWKEKLESKTESEGL